MMRHPLSNTANKRVLTPWLQRLLLAGCLVLMQAQAHSQAKTAPPAKQPKCSVTPALLNRASLLRNPEVRGVSISKDRHSATLLLSQAGAIWLRTFGCAHAGMAVSTWLYELPPSIPQRLHLAGQMARLASGLPFKGVRWSTEDFVDAQDPSLRGLAFHLRDAQVELDIQVNYQAQSDGTYVLQIVF